MIRTVAAVAALSFVASVSANTVTLTGTSSITASGQSFFFNFAGVDQAISAGTLTIDALGDYSITPPSSETLTWDIDGIASGVGFDSSAFADPNNVDLFQNSVSQTWTISLGDMQAITADGIVEVSLQNAPAVNFFVDQPDDFFAFRLTFEAIPAPGAVALAGLAGVAAVRRRR